jgi:hypothetical protein
MIDPAWPTDEEAQSILSFAQAALDAYLAGEPQAALWQLVELRAAYGEAGLYLATVLLGANLDHRRIDIDLPGGRDLSDRDVDVQDCRDALRFAAAVEGKDRPAADAIWDRLVAERRQGDLPIAMLELYAVLYGRNRRSDPPADRPRGR